MLFEGVEVTRQCNLRCAPCFFFQAFQHDQRDLPGEELLPRLHALQ
jgi:molybdenum cofactor biosynthesis enzyme MoaA